LTTAPSPFYVVSSTQEFSKTRQKEVVMTPTDSLHDQCINTIRFLSADAVQQANSGHPGMPMGTAAIGYQLWTRFLAHNPANPSWPNRDRFVLSAGHGSMLIYSLLHLTGYDLSLDDIKNFRQWNSPTAGHPEYGHCPGVEITTGPLGQGAAHAVGMAMAERYLATEFNKPDHEIVDHFTYAIIGDGDLMEGLSYEAIALAGHLKLGKLIYLWDDNRITIEGGTDLATSENQKQRFEANGWEVITIDGNDLEAISDALTQAKANLDQPTLIAARTHIGHGAPNKQDTAGAHGAPLGDSELDAAKEALGWPTTPRFHVPDEVLAYYREAGPRGEALEAQWQARFEAYGEAYPEEKQRFECWLEDELPDGWDSQLNALAADSAPAASRAVSGKAICAISEALGNLVGGSADLGPSNNTTIKGKGSFAPGEVSGPNIHFGIREHAMAAITGGMALHGGLRPYCGTFLVFSDYMRPSIRLASLMEIPAVYVFTHDSIGVGEDGPTHQPVEHVPALRLIPGLTVIRPADTRETVEAWWTAVQRPGPVALILSRQNLPALPREYPDRPPLPATAHGAYVMAESSAGRDKTPDLILIASGSEVQLCMQARELLEKKSIATRVVSMPSWELFEEQPDSYKRYVLPPTCTNRLAVEAASTMGWERYTGRSGAVIGLDRFGASAPASILFERFGFSAENIASQAHAMMKS
jgi:transketolase